MKNLLIKATADGRLLVNVDGQPIATIHTNSTFHTRFERSGDFDLSIYNEFEVRTPAPVGPAETVLFCPYCSKRFTVHFEQ